jgi:translation initiation factor IF-1
MAKEELLEMNGVVVEVLPDSRFRVTLDNGHNLVAYSAGKCASTTSASSPATRFPSSCHPTT